LILEAARCVEDGIAASPGDVDMCLILGLGLPRYLGGALKYADYLGLKTVVESAGKRESLGLSTGRASTCGPRRPWGIFFIPLSTSQFGYFVIAVSASIPILWFKWRGRW